MNKILCLDLSLNSTGWSILNDNILLSYGVIVPDKYLNDVERLIYIKNIIESIFNMWKIDKVVIEDVYYVKNMKTYCSLCQLVGIARLLSYSYVGNNIFVLPATHVRSSFGLKTKQEVFDFVVDKYSLLEFYFKKHNDICDSIMLGLGFLDGENTIKTKKMMVVESNIGENLKDYLIKEYWSEEKSLKNISKSLKIGYSTLHNWFNNLKIPIRYRSFQIDRFPTKLTYEQEQVLFGTVLGDGGLFKSNRDYGNYCLQISHATKHKEYLEYKANIFDIFFSCLFDCFRDESYLSTFRTIYHPIFSRYRKLFYKNNIKRVTTKILDKLDPLAIAVWFMDDGNYYNKSRWDVISIATHSFSKGENELIAEWFNSKFNIDFKVTKATKDKSIYYYLRTGKKRNINLFFEIIGKYVVEPMKYKIK